MKKYIFVLFLVFSLVFSLTACKKKRTKETKPSKEVNTTSQVVVTYEVTEDEFKAAFELLSSKNYTNTSSVLMSNGEEGMTIKEVLKLSEEGYSAESSMINIMYLSAEDVIDALETMHDVEIDKTLEGDALIEELNKHLDDLIKEEEFDAYSYKDEMYQIETISFENIEYFKFIKDEPEFVLEYEYDDDLDCYFLIKDFKDLEDLIINDMGLMVLKDYFSAVSYDEESSRYALDFSVVASALGAVDANVGDCYIEFENKKISKMSFTIKESMGEEEITESVEISFSNYGTTVVDFPKENQIFECPHDSLENDYDYNETSNYHVLKCNDCDSIVLYEKHTFGLHDTCTTCGYTKYSEEEVKLDDKYCKDHIYLEKDSDGCILYVGTRNFDDYEDTEARYCEKCGLAYIYGTYSYDYIYDESGCYSVGSRDYKFFDINDAGNDDADNPTVFVKEYTVKSYNASHSYGYIDIPKTDEANPCRTTYTRTCTKCGFSFDYYIEEHDYELIDSKTTDVDCVLVDTYKCSVCDKTYTIKELKHDYVLVDYELDEYGYNMCHTYKCSVCEEEYELEIYSYNKTIKSHNINYYDFITDEYVYKENEAHEFDEFGVCIYCGLDLANYIELFNNKDDYFYVEIKYIDEDGKKGYYPISDVPSWDTMGCVYKSNSDGIGTYTVYLTTYETGVNTEIRVYEYTDIVNFDASDIEDCATLNKVYIVYENDGESLAMIRGVAFFEDVDGNYDYILFD